MKRNCTYRCKYRSKIVKKPAERMHEMPKRSEFTKFVLRMSHVGQGEHVEQDIVMEIFICHLFALNKN